MNLAAYCRVSTYGCNNKERKKRKVVWAVNRKSKGTLRWKSEGVFIMRRPAKGRVPAMPDAGRVASRGEDSPLLDL